MENNNFIVQTGVSESNGYVVNNFMKLATPDGKPIRIVIFNNDNLHPWFVGKDVGLALGYTENNYRTAIKDHVPLGETSSVSISDGTPGNPNMVIVSLQGVMLWAMRSHAINASVFVNWVINDVLLSINSVQGYLSPEMVLQLQSNPGIVDTYLAELITAREKEQAAQHKASLQLMYRMVDKETYPDKDREEKRQMIATMTPYANLGMAVYAPTACVTLNMLAKILHNATDENTADFGKPNVLLAILRRDGYLHKTYRNYNMPTQKSTNSNLMTVVYDECLKKFIPLVTPTGINYFLHLYVLNTINNGISDEDLIAAVKDPFEEHVPMEEISVIETVDK